MANDRRTEKTSVPGVYRRGAKYVYAYRANGRQRWGTASSLDDARRSKRQADSAADRGEVVEPSRLGFGEFARDWIETYQGRTSAGFRESTRRSYRQMLEDRVIPYFDARRRLRLIEIQPRDVKAFVRWLIEQEDPRVAGRLLSKSTVRQHVAVLRALLGDAMEEGLIRNNPAAGVRVSVPEGEGTRRVAAGDTRAMTIAELRTLLLALRPEWRLLFELLAHTGLRIGEAIELRWGRDIVLSERPHLKVRRQFADGRACEPKTRYGRRDIPLSRGLADRLIAARGARADDELVFTTGRGTRLNRHNLYRDVLAPATRAAELPWVTLHTFRHTCASLLFAPIAYGGGGKNAKQVQEWLGHHSPAYTLKQYVHLIDGGVGTADFLDLVTRTAAKAATPAASVDASAPPRERPVR